MVWVRLDDAFYDHPKVMKAGALAELLWVRSLAWCNRNRPTSPDGTFPLEVVWRLASFCPRLTVDGDSVSPADLATALVREGLWDEVPGGYRIHDYSEYQLSDAQLEDLRAKRSAAGRKGAEARWQTDGKPMASAIAGDGQTDAPYPESRINPSSSSLRDSDSAPLPVDDDIPEAAWAVYAKEQRKSATEPVRSSKRYDATTIANGKADPELCDKARRWWKRWDITPTELGQAMASDAVSVHWQERKNDAA